MSFADWKQSFAYVGPGTQHGTMEEAMLHFFYAGISPWIKGFGYKWSTNDSIVAKKFVYHCYVIMTTAPFAHTYTLEPPVPKHRNYEEDRDTFDHFVDTDSFIAFLENWKFRDEIVGTRLDYFLREFCYVWLDVTSGKPGTYTEKVLEAEEPDSEEEVTTLQEIYSKKSGELY
jgi:hypothetical protein